jgi:dissimilatory sulfite reductase (desulfoviridin) alpha/beta subunit
MSELFLAALWEYRTSAYRYTAKGGTHVEGNRTRPGKPKIKVGICCFTCPYPHHADRGLAGTWQYKRRVETALGPCLEPT